MTTAKKARFDRIYSEYFASSLRVVRGFPSLVHDAEDILHDVFLKFFRLMDDVPEAKEKAYILTAVRNTCWDRLKKSRCVSMESLELVRGKGLELHSLAQTECEPSDEEGLNEVVTHEIGRLVITHKDRLLRFGSEPIFSICEHVGCEVVVVNSSDDSSYVEDLTKDVLEIITVFSARLYGSRSYRNRTIVESLKLAADEACK